MLKGSDLILHAGDVGRDEVLDALEDIAPVVAGPRRFTLPVTVRRLQVSEDGVVGEIFELAVLVDGRRVSGQRVVTGSLTPDGKNQQNICSAFPSIVVNYFYTFFADSEDVLT